MNDPRFDALKKDHAERLHVMWHISPMFSETSITGLRRFGSVKGNGAIAIKEICALADQLGVTLTVGTSRDALKPWYESFGFVPIQQRPPTTIFKRKPTK